jgi:hypothetical protein
MARESITKAQSGRVRRTPITVRNRLSVKDRDPNYHYRIVNVKDDRIEQFQEQGYEIVQATQVGDKQVDNPSTLGSGTEVSVGQGMKAVLMRIPKEWYQEDQTAKQAQIDELEATMKADATKGS